MESIPTSNLLNSLKDGSLNSLNGGRPITPPTSPRRDQEFYCEDVVFLVGDILFKVPRRPFELDSSFFQEMLSSSADTPASAAKGTSDEHPITLLGATEDEFRALLLVIYRPSYGPAKTPTKDQWVSVLKLSTMWMFDVIREQASSKLDNLVRDSVSRIVLARTYRITGWMEPALISLAQQETLSAEDLERLGWDTVARLYQVRESIAWGGSCTCACNYCNVAHGPVALHTNGHLHGHAPGGSARLGVVSAATLRRSYEFSQKIRELFGTDLY